MEFHKYKKIKQLGDEDNEDIFKDGEDLIYIQEKVDGGNFRFYINEEGSIIFGSRSQEIDEDDKNKKNFIRCLNHIREKTSGKNLEKYKGKIFYGECMVKHTIGYDWETTPPFIGFDILDSDGRFIECDDMVKIYSELGLDFIPLIKIVHAHEIKEVTDDDVPKSRYYGGQAEGIVFKNYDKQIYAKYVRAAFKEKNKEEFGGCKKHATTDEEYFTAVYCTNARIEKVIWKLNDDGNKLHLSLMPLLIKAVYKDIWEENWNEIVSTKQKTINFDKLKKAFTRRCFAVLKSIITNNALNSSNVQDASKNEGDSQ